MRLETADQSWIIGEKDNWKAKMFRRGAYEREK